MPFSPELGLAFFFQPAQQKKARPDFGKGNQREAFLPREPDLRER
jgi:hypothetical protein